jgi:thiol-disulfide isomerase/thioredoxin
MRYFRTGIRIAVLLAAAFVFATALLAQGQQLTLNPHLDYNSDSVDGPLITGNDTETGVVAGKPNYVMIYGEGCFNSKRQARRTVALSERYGDKVNFVIIDLDKPQSPAQLKLVQNYYQGSIPDLVVLDGYGKPVYNQAGEQTEDVLSHILDTALEERH